MRVSLQTNGGSTVRRKKLACFERRTVWWPTPFGWCCLVLAPLAVLAIWGLSGESILASTKRVNADTLIVEAWIGLESLPFVKEEFERGGYKRLVVTGGLTGQKWSKERWSLTDAAYRELSQIGFPKEKLILAPSRDVENQRTYEMALAARRAMSNYTNNLSGINIVTRGAHARRTKAVYRKVFGSGVAVGAIAWRPDVSHGLAWWKSSTRSKELLDETFGYAFELFADSGRNGVPWRTLIPTSIIILGIFLIPSLRRLRAQAAVRLAIL